MMISTRGPLAAALIAISLAGCSSFTPDVFQPALDSDPDQLLAQAAQQQPAEAARTRLNAADILARSGRRPEALDIASHLDDHLLQADDRRAWAMLLSELGDSLGDPRSVLRAAEVLDEQRFPSDEANLLRLRQGLAFGQIGEPLLSAQALLQVQTDTRREDINDAIWEALAVLSAQQADSLAQPDNAIVTGWLALAALVRNSGGDVQRLLPQLDDWRVRHSDHPANRRMPSQITGLKDLHNQEIDNIAVMLPQSGPLASVADAIKRGISTHQSNLADAAQLTFIDSSRGDLNALYQQAQSSGAQVIIGPLDKAAVTQLEGLDSVPIPTLALNYGEGAVNTTEGLFEYGLSAEDEAHQAAERAWQDGHRRAAMLVPNNHWGQRVGEAFWNRWSALGGEISNAVRYNPDAPATDSTHQAIAAPRPDMLFLLALPDYARQVKPTLEYYSAGDLPVYATSHLYSGHPQPRLDSDLNGVQFLDIPWQIPDAAVGGVDALPFATSYQQLRTEGNPALFRLQAMGVDAYELALRIPQFEALPQTRMQGATGTLGNDAGRIYRELPWAVFANGVPAPILIGLPQPTLDTSNDAEP